MRLEAGAATDVGRVRDRNEDSLLVEDPLYAVADGMGGHLGGDVASRLAVETLHEIFGSGTEPLHEQVRRANEVVFERSLRDRNVAGMGTTLTVAVMEGDRLRLAHVGDSRAYLLRGGDLRQLTEDHTLVARMVKKGEITRREAETHPHRSVLTRVVGTEPEVVVDESTVPLLDGDRVLLCTDGLTGMVTEEQVKAILESEPEPQAAADRLVRAANRAGGIDNVTAVVLDAHQEEGARAGAGPREAGRKSGIARPTMRRLAVPIAIALVVLAGLLVALRIYADHQWYVGDDGGRVAVFQGFPAIIGPFHLSRVAVDTDIGAAQAEALPLYSGLSSGITAASEEDALTIVQQIKRDLASPQSRPPLESSPTPTPSAGAP